MHPPEQVEGGGVNHGIALGPCGEAARWGTNLVLRSGLRERTGGDPKWDGYLGSSLITCRKSSIGQAGRVWVCTLPIAAAYPADFIAARKAVLPG
jgi:hypothetical protein